MADIFVSYASEDRERVRPLVNALEARGFTVWWDSRIDIGSSYDREIEHQLKAASCVVTVWSEASVDSDWVRDETQDGLDRNILVPIQIDDCRLPLGFRRTQTAQFLDWPNTPHDLSVFFDRIVVLTRGVAIAEDAPTQAMKAPAEATPKAEPHAGFAADALEAKYSPHTKHLQLRGAPAKRRSGLRRLMGGAVGLIALLAFFLTRSVWLQPSGDFPVPPERWDQLTDFPDSVSQPALSPDGRILTFIRGGGSFVTPGQIYSKLLPDGTPVPLTEDDSLKMSPAFSPDGSRIAYTVFSGRDWDTWRVEALGGHPGLWLPNASGLVWIDEEDLMFSERIRGEGIHMKIVAARETRAGARDVYVPEHINGMAHRSAASPDGAWAIVVEMDAGPWVPCRLVPLRGSAPSRQVGPPEGSCTFAAWSPDGEWMYFTSRAGGGNHIWRQAFPDGDLQQVTSGATEQEGIAVSLDGDFLITAVTLKKSSVFIYEQGNVRAVSSEGYAFDPQFTPDGRYLLFRILQGTAPVSDASELWIADLRARRTELFLPGFSLFGYNAYDISASGTEVVIAALDLDGRSRLWIAPLDRSAPPRQVPEVEGHTPFFGADDEIIFSAAIGSADGRMDFVFRVKRDGTGLHKAIEPSVSVFEGLSPDGAWLIAMTGGIFTQAFPLKGGEPIDLYSGAGTTHKVRWTSDGRFLLLPDASGAPWLEGGAFGKTHLIPIPPGRIFPHIPAEGYTSGEAISAIPGVTTIGSGDVAPGPVPDVYAYSQQTVQRNLYMIPLP